MIDKYYLIAFNSITALGTKSKIDLLEAYNYDFVSCWEDYRNWHTLPIRNIEAAIAARAMSNSDELYEEYLRSGASCCCKEDPEYPELLKEIYDAPPVLFYKGIMPAQDELCIAMVGSRHATAYGRLAAETIADGLAQRNISIVSGMARGIDSVCHNAAIKKGCPTYAILGCGIDIIYPRENDKLYKAICEQGAVISELPIGAPPLPKNFPRRNRIISGMSKGLIVVEAGEKSGTLITVSEALEQNRDVFAVPGPITSTQSKGVNNLLKNGCKPITCAEDICNEYAEDLAKRKLQLNPGTEQTSSNTELTPDEAAINALLLMPMQFDAIIQQTGKSTSELNALLTIMEIKGIVKQLPGKFYISNFAQ